MSMLFAAFGWGLLSSFSACVYPLIPITTAIFAGGERKSWVQGFRASGVYTLGMSLTYGALGVIAALSGVVFGKYFGNPYFITIIGFLLIYLGLAYAHLVPLPLPNFANRLQVGKKDALTYPLILGIFSAFIAAPCTAPFFGNVLVQISKSAGSQQSVLLPTLAAFAFAFGMGVPFLLIGLFSIRLPKPGVWLHAIEYAGAVTLIAAGFHYLEDLAGDFPPVAQAFPFAVIGFAMCVTFFILSEPMKREHSMPFRLKLNTAGMLMISGLGLFLFTSPFVKYWGAEVKNNTGAVSDVNRKVTMTLPAGKLKWYKDLAEAKTVAAKEGKILFIDFWADWCTACEEMERKLFVKDEFINFALENKILPVRIDYSSPTDELDKLAQSYNIRGLPTVVLTKPDGELIHTMTGFYSKEYSMRELKSALKD
ncbi:MAG: thioredoxin family protein [Turneriella sp.]|nr:thioredoxin family protein [Turneriella sp.]